MLWKNMLLMGLVGIGRLISCFCGDIDLCDFRNLKDEKSVCCGNLIRISYKFFGRKSLFYFKDAMGF